MPLKILALALTMLLAASSASFVHAAPVKLEKDMIQCLFLIVIESKSFQYRLISLSKLGCRESDRNARTFRMILYKVRYRMYAAGAHYVVDSIEELPALIESINARMNRE